MLYFNVTDTVAIDNVIFKEWTTPAKTVKSFLTTHGSCISGKNSGN